MFLSFLKVLFKPQIVLLSNILYRCDVLESGNKKVFRLKQKMTAKLFRTHQIPPPLCGYALIFLKFFLSLEIVRSKSTDCYIAYQYNWLQRKWKIKSKCLARKLLLHIYPKFPRFVNKTNKHKTKLTRNDTY